MKNAAALVKPANASGKMGPGPSLLERQTALGSHMGVGLEPVPRIVHRVLNSPGQPLDSSTRDYFEPRFRATLGDVPSSGPAWPSGLDALKLGGARDAAEQQANQISQEVVRGASSRGKSPCCSACAGRAAGAAGCDFSRVRLHTGPEAVESARSIHALAFTAGNHVVWGANSALGGTQKEKLIMAEELAHVVQHSRPGGDATTIRRFTKYDKSQGYKGEWQVPDKPRVRVSDDGWGPKANQLAWTTPSKVAEANRILGGKHSAVRLGTTSGETMRGRAPGSYMGRTLQRIEVKSLSGGPPNLKTDCGEACKQIMGSEGREDVAVIKNPRTRVGRAISAVLNPSPPSTLYGGGEGKTTARGYQPYGGKTSVERWSEEIYKTGIEREYGFSNLTRDEGLSQYNNLTAEEKDEFDRKYRINKYAVPGVGQGITIGTEFDMPHFQQIRPDTWHYHFAANVLSSGHDYVTLEIAAGWGPGDWIFYMYGPESKSQSFHEKHERMGSHGTKATSMVVQPAE